MAATATVVRGGEITAEIAKLDVRERAISRRRREIHRQIDALYLVTPLGEVDVAWLQRLEVSEREISAKRRRLHAEIDDLRARLGLPPWRLCQAFDDAA
jgi:hypothetical protein